MAGQEKVFLIIGRNINGWFEIATSNDEEGNSLSLPYDDEFFNFLIGHLEKAGCPIEIIEEMKEAFQFGVEVLESTKK